QKEIPLSFRSSNIPPPVNKSHEVNDSLSVASEGAGPADDGGPNSYNSPMDTESAMTARSERKEAEDLAERFRKLHAEKTENGENNVNENARYELAVPV